MDANEFPAQFFPFQRRGNFLVAVVENVFNDVVNARTPIATDAPATIARQEHRAGRAAALTIKRDSPAPHAGESFASVVHG